MICFDKISLVMCLRSSYWIVCVWQVGRMTPEVLYLDSLGSVTFLGPRVFGWFLIDLLPILALEGWIFL